MNDSFQKQQQDEEDFNLDSLSLDTTSQFSYATESSLETVETPLDFLTKMFQNIPLAQLTQELETNYYDLPKTIEKLINFDRNQVPPPPKVIAKVNQMDLEQKSSEASIKVCRHFMEGNCFRKDCWFRHSFDSVLCKFFLKGYCSNGDLCPFQHQLPTLGLNPTQPKVVSSSFVKVPNPREDFPNLTGSSKTKVNFSLDFKSRDGIGYDKVVKYSKLQTKMPWLNSAILEQYLLNCDYDIERAYQILIQRFPKPKHFSTTQPKPNSKPKPIPTKLSLNQRIQRLPKINESIPWLEFGSSVNQLYQTCRKDAIHQLKLRNQAYDKSRTAYLNNKLHLAKKFAEEAKVYHQKMVQFHKKAAQTIFQQNNLGKGNLVDLHGLFVAEVEHYLQQVLNCKLDHTPIYLIVGTGHHSSDIPKLLPPVLDLLDRNHKLYYDCSPDGRGGMLKVVN